MKSNTGLHCIPGTKDVTLDKLHERLNPKKVLIGLTVVTMSVATASAAVITHNKNTGPLHTLDDHVLVIAMPPEPINGIQAIFSNDPYHPVLVINQAQLESDTLNNPAVSSGAVNFFNSVAQGSNSENSKFPQNPRLATYGWLADRAKRDTEAATAAVAKLYYLLGKQPPQTPIMPELITAIGGPSWGLNGEFYIPVLDQVNSIHEKLASLSAKSVYYPVAVIDSQIGLWTVTYSDVVTLPRDGFEKNNIEKVTVNGKDYYAFVKGNNIDFGVPIYGAKNAAGKIIALATTNTNPPQMVPFDTSENLDDVKKQYGTYNFDYTYLEQIQNASDDKLMTKQSAVSDDNPNGELNYEQILALGRETDIFFHRLSRNG